MCEVHQMLVMRRKGDGFLALRVLQMEEQNVVKEEVRLTQPLVNSCQHNEKGLEDIHW